MELEVSIAQLHRRRGPSGPLFVSVNEIFFVSCVIKQMDVMRVYSTKKYNILMIIFIEKCGASPRVS